MHPKKQAICEATLQLLSEPSETNKLTLNAIAKKLDIGKSTIYEYFHNKAQIIESALGYLIDQHLESLLSDTSILNQSFEVAFKNHYQTLLDLYQNKQSLQEMMSHSDVAQLPKENKEAVLLKMISAFNQTQQRLYQILSIGVKENILEKTIDKTQLQTIEALIFGSLLAMAQPYNDWNQPDMIEAIYRNVIRLHQN